MITFKHAATTPVMAVVYIRVNYFVGFSIRRVCRVANKKPRAVAGRKGRFRGGHVDRHAPTTTAAVLALGARARAMGRELLCAPLAIAGPSYNHRPPRRAHSLTHSLVLSPVRKSFSRRRTIRVRATRKYARRRHDRSRRCRRRRRFTTTLTTAGRRKFTPCLHITTQSSPTPFTRAPAPSYF